LLEPPSVYQFLLAVAYGYQLRCTNILRHFDGRITKIVKDYLAANSVRKVDRNDLIAIMDNCITQADHTLAVEDYHDALAEQALETPFDPDFESEQYYEHESRLEVDEDYAEGQDITQSSARRQLKEVGGGPVAWVSLLQKSKSSPPRGL
jgi:hypothetical protein